MRFCLPWKGEAVSRFQGGTYFIKLSLANSLGPLRLVLTWGENSRPVRADCEGNKCACYTGTCPMYVHGSSWVILQTGGRKETIGLVWEALLPSAGILRPPKASSRTCLALHPAALWLPLSPHPLGFLQVKGRPS